MDQNHGGKHKLDYEEFGRDFAHVLYAGKTRSKRRHGETERAATFKSLAEARKAFDEVVGTEGAWPEEDEEQLAIPAL
jgi:hypothetical protein